MSDNSGNEEDERKEKSPTRTSGNTGHTVVDWELLYLCCSSCA